MKGVGPLIILLALFVTGLFIVAPDSHMAVGIAKGFRTAHEVWVAGARTAGWDVR